MTGQHHSSGLRQAEIMMALSLATDLGTGRPMEWALCSALLSIRLGEVLALSDQELREVYYLALLRYIGCTSEMEITLELFGDNPSLAGRNFDFIDSTKPRQMLGWVFHHVGAGQPPLNRIRAIAKMPAALPEYALGHCEVAEQLIQRLGFENSLQEAIWHMYERWDGTGNPRHIQGEALSLPMRIIHVVQDVETFRRAYGVEAAVAAIRQRAGHSLDPYIVERFCVVADDLLADLEDAANWEKILAAEPGSQTYLSEEEFDNAALVLADFIDLVSPYFACHSRQVAELARSAAQQFGLPASDIKAIQRMGWLHDLGKIGISPGIWHKSRSLTDSEWERVRLHPYYTERILARPDTLAKLGRCAALHHECLNGSGYHRGLQANAISPAARLLAAANFYQARLEPRPYRDALTPEAAVDAIRREVRVGRLDGDAAKAVLAAAGHHTTLVRRDRVSGLTEREIDVLRLIARGFSNRQIAEHLRVSQNTVITHIRHIYEKINVSTRSGATLFTMQNGILSELRS